MSSISNYWRLVWLAGLSSAAQFLAAIVFTKIDDGIYPEVLGHIATAAVLMLFGALVLLPHVANRMKTPVRVLGVVTLPILVMLLASVAVIGANKSVEMLVDGYIPLTVSYAILAIGSGVWILGLGAALLWIGKLRPAAHFFRNLLLVAIVVAGLVFIFFDSFCMFQCSKWDGPLLTISGILLISGIPLGLTTVLYLGIVDTQSSFIRRNGSMSG